MKSNISTDNLEYRATEALRALLGQVSVITLKEIRRAPQGPMLARVDVLGHNHTLACEIEPNVRHEDLRKALDELCRDAANCEDAATPLLIAPYLSPEAQAICKERSASYLDLEGNARLALGEVFIGKRSTRIRAANCPSHRAPAPILHALPSARPALPAGRHRATA